MIDVEFIYGPTESKYIGMESYYIYDFTSNNIVEDLKGQRSLISIDRNEKRIYFMCMETEHHYILARAYFSKIIQKFINELDKFDCVDYEIYPDTTGGELYYKYIN